MYSPTHTTPVIDIPWSSPVLPQNICCLLRPGTYRLSRQHAFRATFTFILRFRLVHFAVYASPLLLPPETQDSLDGGSGLPFHRGTFTRKRDAPYPSAARDTCNFATQAIRIPYKRIFTFWIPARSRKKGPFGISS